LSGFHQQISYDLLFLREQVAYLFLPLYKIGYL
jgi:hypothetical protein